MSLTDIDLRMGGVHFAVRAAGVCLHAGHVLLHTFDGSDLWCLPGGRMRIGETAAQAVQREMAEEIGVAVTVGPLQWVMENFFELGGEGWQELGLYHLAEIQDPGWYDLSREYRGREGESLGLTYRWVPIERVGELNLVPRPLVAALQALPGPVGHLFHDER